MRQQKKINARIKNPREQKKIRQEVLHAGGCWNGIKRKLLAEWMMIKDITQLP